LLWLLLNVILNLSAPEALEEGGLMTEDLMAEEL
jgi:hypothetical protein